MTRIHHDEISTLRPQYTRDREPPGPVPHAFRRTAAAPRRVAAVPCRAVVAPCHGVNVLRRVVFLLVAIATGPLLAPAARADTEPGRVLRDYLQARMQGDLPAAEAMWEPRDLRLATALGIRFTDVEAAYDDYWMLSARAREARAARMRAVVRDSVVDGRGVLFTVLLEPRDRGAAADTLSYFVKNTGDGWHVALPLQDLTTDWTRREGRFIRVRTQRIVHFSQHALSAVESEIARLFEELGAPQSAVLRLERIKLDYYLCDDADDVRRLVGSLEHEGYLPAAGRLVSRAFVDVSDLVPLVLQLVLRTLPLQNEPFFTEGLPLALGGTTQANAAVVLQRARNANLDGKRLQLAFDPATPREVALPLEALWNRMLLHELGATAFLDLWKQSAEDRAAAQEDDARRVLPRIESALGKKGDALWSWGTEHLDDIEDTVAPGCEAWPPDIRGLEAILLWRDTKEEWSLQGYVVGDRYVFALGPYIPGPPQWMRDHVDSLAMIYEKEVPEWVAPEPGARPAGDPPPVFFLVRVKLEQDLEPYESRLYQRQFLSRNYRNDLWGFFITPDDVKLYSYPQDKILAEYVASESSTPGHPYYLEAPGRICFSVPTTVFPRPLTSYYVQLGIYTGE